MSMVDQLLFEKPVAYHPALARAFSSVAAAIFFEHVATWQGNNPEQWVFRTQEEIHQSTALTTRVQSTARAQLVELNVLEEKHDGMPRRLYYRPNWDGLDRLLQSHKNATLNHSDVNSGPNKSAELRKGYRKGVPPSAGGEPPTSAFQLMTHYADLLDTASPLSKKERGRLARVLDKRLQVGDEPITLRFALCRMVTRRKEGQKLELEDCLGDVMGVKAVPSRQKVEENGSPEELIEALANYDRDGDTKLRRLAPIARKWDFTSDDDPPWSVKFAISEDNGERNGLIERVRSVWTKIQREQQEAAHV